MRKRIPVLLVIWPLLIALGIPLVMAQTATSVPSQQNEPQSTVDIFFVACADKAIVELSGEMRPNFDIYYQVFSQAGGGGTALTSLRRVQVDGTYALSDSVTYNDGQTVAAGTTASVKVSIARESDSSRTVFDTVVNDIQDGCIAPTRPSGTSIDLGSPQPESTEVAVSGSGVLSPFGGELNPGLEPEPAVKIGARATPGRTANPGLIFAECDKYPLTNPGVIYDTDDIIIFWSWFAKTPELAQLHVDHAQYVVTLNGESFPYVERTPITQRGKNYWVFYIARVGRYWQPGDYGVEYRLSWDIPISDGYNDFGPGTANESDYSTCTFKIQPNPYGVPVSHVAPPMPKPE